MPIRAGRRRRALEAGGWLMRGSLVTVSLPLAANTPARVTIRAEDARVAAA